MTKYAEKTCRISMKLTISTQFKLWQICYYKPLTRALNIILCSKSLSLQPQVALAVIMINRRLWGV